MQDEAIRALVADEMLKRLNAEAEGEENSYETIDTDELVLVHEHGEDGEEIISFVYEESWDEVDVGLADDFDEEGQPIAIA